MYALTHASIRCVAPICTVEPALDSGAFPLIIDRRDFVKLSGAVLTRAALSADAPRNIGIVGVPFNSAGTTGGVSGAPAALRDHGLVAQLSKANDVRDYGDVKFAASRPLRDPVSGIKSVEAIVSMVPAVETVVARVLADGRFPLVLGGDCPVMLGGVAAARRRLGRVGLMFVDGHEDAYPPHASPTGEAADMELGFALGLYLKGAPENFANRFPLVQPSDTVILGVRDTADLRHDKVTSLASKVHVISDAQAQTQDCAVLAREQLAQFKANGVPGVWLHTDLDVLSSTALPAVDYRQPGGFSWGQLAGLAHTAIHYPSTIGWDVTIYNPDLDPHQAHAATIVKFIVAAFDA